MFSDTIRRIVNVTKENAFERGKSSSPKTRRGRARKQTDTGGQRALCVVRVFPHKTEPRRFENKRIIETRLARTVRFFFSKTDRAQLRFKTGTGIKLHQF